MRAIVITRPGGPEVLELEERERPEPGLGQIRVRVHSSALNRVDLLQRRGMYSAPAGGPRGVPGLEYAGEVDAVGESASLWNVGSRVMGIIGGGGHAEFLVVHEREAIAVPENLSWEEAAAVPEGFLTAYDALFRQLHVRVGETVLIHAVGSGVGTAAVQLGRVAGARVIGTSRSTDKLERAKALGLHVGIDTSREDWPSLISAATRGHGVDAVVDLLGGDYLRQTIPLIAPRGRLILVGLTAGRTAELDLGTILNRRVQITGTVLRARSLEEKIALAREFSDRVVPLFESHQLRAVVDRVYSFGEISQAHSLMESNANFGKIVLRWA